MPKEKLAQLRTVGREAEAFRFGAEGLPKVFIGFVHSPTVHMPFAAALMKTLMCLQYRVTVVPIPSGPNISGPRNDVVKAFLATDDDWLLWVDSDIGFEPEQVGALISHDLPIVGGTYLNRFASDEDPIPVCSVSLGDGTFGKGEQLEGQSGVVEVAGLGMGFTLVAREVHETLGTGVLWPFAEIAVKGEQIGATSDEAKDVTHLLSEDITFCFRAASKGFKVYLDLDTRVRHYKNITYV